jgi:hypothetical protein
VRLEQRRHFREEIRVAGAQRPRECDCPHVDWQFDGVSEDFLDPLPTAAVSMMLSFRSAR